MKIKFPISKIKFPISTLEVTTYTYDAMGHLAQAVVGTYASGVLAAREIEDYAYDYSGHRVGVVHSIDANANMTPESWTTRTMLVDSQNFTGSPQVLEKTLYDDSATPVIIQRQAYLNALEIAAQTTTQYVSGVPDTSETLYLAKDGQNSTRLATDVDADIVESYDYDAFGSMLVAGSTSTNVLYRSEPLDTLTGNYNLDARMYDPGIGRFNSFDPYPGSLNKYAYCHNDPVNFADPTGQFEGLVGMMVTMALGSSFNVEYNTHVAYTGLDIVTDFMYAGSTMNAIWGQPKHNNTATFITHGVGPHGAGWSSEFQNALRGDPLDPNSGLKGTDFMEYTWSGFALNYGFVPAERTHNIAVAFQVLAFDVAMAKGYDSIDVIGHSWGTAITYDAIEQSGLHFRNWVTMGAPLRADTSKPNVGRWIDIYSNYDPVTWLNMFPPFPQIDTGSWTGFFCSGIPLLGQMNRGFSSERLNADVLRDDTGNIYLKSSAGILGGIYYEHTAYWKSSFVQEQIVGFLR